MTELAARVPLVLAATPATGGNQPGGQGQEFGSSSPIALVVILLLLIATALLIYSMSKHLKKIPKSFDPEPESESDGAPTSASSSASPAPSPSPDSASVDPVAKADQG